MSPTPTVTAIIPMFNDAATVAGAIGSLRQQDYPADQLEIIAVDSGSNDGSPQVARAAGARVEQIDHPRRGPAAARNRGAGLAAGEVLLFLDADVELMPNCLRLLTAGLEQKQVVAAGAGILNNLGDFWQRCDNYVHFRTYIAHGRIREVDRLSGFALAVTAPAFGAVGGFDLEETISEDAEFCLRLRRGGGRILFVPQARCRHRTRRDRLARLLEHSYVWGQHSVLYRFRHADHFPIQVWLYRRPIALLLAAPLLALGATAKALTMVRALEELIFIPFFFPCRLAWLLGAVRTLRRGTEPLPAQYTRRTGA
jgi:GT2 family glycosyltransferase